MGTRLSLLNLARWIREHLLVWGFLSTIYSITLALLLQPILEMGFQMEIDLRPLWASTCLLLLVPALIERIPGAIPWSSPRVTPGDKKDASEESALASLYLRHEARRLATWGCVLGVVLAIWIAGLLPGRPALALLLLQLPTQRALFSIHHWRRLALLHHAAFGAGRLLWALFRSQALQSMVAWLALGLLSGAWTHAVLAGWLRLGLAALAGVAAACCVAMEGDSGRPWIVNFISLAAGAVGALLALIWPFAAIFVVYFSWGMMNSVAERLRSVEHVDEDTVIP